MDDLINQLTDIRGVIDDIDATPFGKLDRLFNDLAKMTDDAIKMAEEALNAKATTI